MDVSVIIVNYNTLRLTKECIESVFQNTENISCEIILVDNASTDGSRDFFEQDSRIIYIYNKENLGFGGANNIGIKMASGRNILFLNSDTVLYNNAIYYLSSFLDSHVSVGGCGGNLYDLNMNPAYSYGFLYPSLLYEINFLLFYLPAKLFFGKNRIHNYTESSRFVKHISGADLMIKREVLDKVGFFNESFFMYREETELCYRIRNAGYKLVNIPDAKIIHLEGKSCSQDKELRKAKWMYDSRKVFLELYHNDFYIWIANVIYRLGIYLRIILHTFYRKQNKNYWKTVLKFK